MEDIHEEISKAAYERRLRKAEIRVFLGGYMNIIVIKTFHLFVGAAFLMVAVVGSTLPALAQNPCDHSSGKEMKVPQTPQEHRGRAEYYKEKATEYRMEAESHRQMLKDYSKSVAKVPKETTEDPYIKKMRLHCEKYIKAAENLARESEEMARYHEMRAKEMEGE